MSAGQQHSLADATINQTTSYAYDHLYRLTGDGPTSYSYDPAGNRASMVQGGTTTNYSYDKADRISAAGSTSYTVNSDGNLTARGSDSFSYDQANRLTSATVAGTASSYTYDGRGKRATKIVGSTTTNYVYDANRRLPVVLDDGTRKYVYGHGLAYATDENGNVQAVYHGDGLRSVRALTDSGANQTGLYRRDAWGVPTVTQGTSTQPFGYTGQLRDGETGLVNLRARMYDPASGRFIQRDSFGGIRRAPPSLNRYSYALNQPVNNRDPNGHCGILITVCVGAGLGAATGLVTYVIEVKSTNKEFSWTGLAVNTAAGAGSGAILGASALVPAVAGGGVLVNSVAGGVIAFGGEAASEWATGEFNPGALAGAAVGGAAGGALAGEITGAVGSDAAKLLANSITGSETGLAGTLSGYEVNQALKPSPAEGPSGVAAEEATPSTMDNGAPVSQSGGVDPSTSTDPSNSDDPGASVDTTTYSGSTASADQTSPDTISTDDSSPADASAGP